MLASTAARLLPTSLRTPLLQDRNILFKPEGGQIAGSVKYRMVYAKLKWAIEKGVIDAKTTLTEITAGSTGVALACLGQKLGLPTELHTYQNASPEKCARIRGYGARLVLHPLTTPMEQLFGEVARKVEKEGYWHLRQYDRSSTMAAYQSLGEEIVEQIHQPNTPPLRIFACPIGTGGLIQGVGTYLRRMFPELRIVAVEPHPDASIDGMRNTEKLHMGAKDPYDRSFPDERITVPAPQGNVYVQGIRLGDSATAVYELAHARKWDGVFMIAPD